MLSKELEILGSRYVTRQEVHETLAIVARRDVWPVVTEVVPMEEAEALHARISAARYSAVPRCGWCE